MAKLESRQTSWWIKLIGKSYFNRRDVSYGLLVSVVQALVSSWKKGDTMPFIFDKVLLQSFLHLLYAVIFVLLTFLHNLEKIQVKQKTLDIGCA
ncbi:uncharacterized protein LOC123200581 isoform X7 [Mangifera indica]|uniref:uncharacterized protein LOC123200581 isoform X7 n=1 Tax=Mangifera indica TaxID=29780 RepID=UPI001CF95E23|nr:uncharacterized protein LOC123200581 isoform X7 [Mangifera indica]